MYLLRLTDTVNPYPYPYPYPYPLPILEGTKKELNIFRKHQLDTKKSIINFHHDKLPPLVANMEICYKVFTDWDMVVVVVVVVY